MDPVNKGMLKLVNSAGLVIDQAVVSVIASAITATRAAAAAWTSATPTILRDILRAVADVRSLNLGYEPNVLLVDDSTWAYLASDTVIAAAMARETANNPVYTGRFSTLAGLQVIPTPAANLPGGVGRQRLGAGHQPARLHRHRGPRRRLPAGRRTGAVQGDASRSATLWRLRARANFVPVVTDPGAGFKITGV
jgi:hypothetical protein